MPVITQMEAHAERAASCQLNIRCTFDVMLDIDMLIKLAPASVATAFASIVLPVPGGPKSSIPLHG